jgi:hypothetical protein
MSFFYEIRSADNTVLKRNGGVAGGPTLPLLQRRAFDLLSCLRRSERRPCDTHSAS